MASSHRGKRNYTWLWGLVGILAALAAVITVTVWAIGAADGGKGTGSSTTTTTTTSTTAEQGNSSTSSDATGSTDTDASSSTSTDANTTTSTTGSDTQTTTTTKSSASTKPSTSTKPIKKPVTIAEAVVGSTGDFLIHTPLLTNYYDAATDTYSYDRVFTHVKPYYKQMDWMVGNLEVTLAGDAYKYQGYPSFNAPDTLIDAMLDSGMDMLLTANNHSFDTRAVGFNRTRSVLKTKGLPFIGTRDKADKPYRVQTINGIKIGMINYTYQTYREDGQKALNGILMTSDTAPLINSFDYNKLNAFYTEMERNIAAMKQDGAEAIMLYIHWGNEYQLKPNSYQKTIAQKMCDLGVDVIVGGHPHVIQPIEILTSSVSGKTTVCAYSVGNELSNQRIAYMDLKTGHTEDGMILQTTFGKTADGKVLVTDVDVLPTWVHTYKEGNKTYYDIIPLDTTKDFTKSFNLSASASGATNAQKSYDRTMALVGDGLQAFDALFAK